MKRIFVNCHYCNLTCSASVTYESNVVLDLCAVWSLYRSDSSMYTKQDVTGSALVNNIDMHIIGLYIVEPTFSVSSTNVFIRVSQ